MKVYKPYPSKGFAWGIGLVVFVTVLTGIPAGINLFSGNMNPGFLLTMGIVLVFVTALAGYFTWSAKNMEYVE